MVAKKRLLTWHRPSKRWKKQIEGVVHYFGYGRCENDTKGYKAAERRYLDVLAERERQQRVDIPLARATLRDVGEKYLQGLEQRHVAGDISCSYLQRAHHNLGRFLEVVGPELPFHSVNELTLEDYRNDVLALRAGSNGSAIAAYTAKGRLSHVKSLISWAYEMGLGELPRNLRRFARIELPEPTPKVFAIDEIKTLWAAASARLRCFIALAINAGYGQQDIADLRVSEINLESGYIERRRSKTKIWTKHRFWPLTMELVKEEMVTNAKGNDRVFLTRNGTPLITKIWAERRLKRSDTIKCSMWRLQQTTGINDGRSFYSLRKTGATLIEQINPAVTEMYLGHADRGMRKHYAQRNWDALAVALDELAQRLDLGA